MIPKLLTLAMVVSCLGLCAYSFAQGKTDLSPVPLVRECPAASGGFKPYPATVTRIVDADTFELVIDLGFSLTLKERVRLAGVDAWEMRGTEREKGKAATEYARSVMPVGSPVVFMSDGQRGSFGRPLGEVILSTCEDLGSLLIVNGHAEPYR